MITIEESKRDQCFGCDRTNDDLNDDGDPVNDVVDVVFTSPKDEERRMPLCVVCRNELFDELTPDDDGEESQAVRELKW